METTNLLILFLVNIQLSIFGIVCYAYEGYIKIKGELTSLNETQNKIYEVLKKNNSIKDEIEK